MQDGPLGHSQVEWIPHEDLPERPSDKALKEDRMLWNRRGCDCGL